MKPGERPPGHPAERRRAIPVALPPGTSTLTIGRQRLDSHRRGGAREYVARVAPAALRATLLQEGPGRYRVSCLDPRGRFLKGGAFIMEVSAESPEPALATARKPGDYPRRPSPTSSLRRSERRVEQRVQSLQEELRATKVANGLLRRESAVRREQHARELLQVHERMEAIQERLGRLADQVKEVVGRQNEHSYRVRGGLAAVREEVAKEVRRREAAITELAAQVEAFATAASEREEQVVEPVRPQQVAISATDGRADFEHDGARATPPMDSPAPPRMVDTPPDFLRSSTVVQTPLRVDDRSAPTPRLAAVGRFLRQERRRRR